MNSTWSYKTINDLLTGFSFFSDGDWVESKDQDEKGNNRLIQLADIGEGKFLNKSSKFLNDEQFIRLRCKPLIDYDILIARMPEPLGRACLFPGLKQRCATVVDVAILRNPDANIYWLMSVINSPDFRRQIEIHSSGTTRTRINKSYLSEISFLAPPKKHQDKIGKILSTVDRAIEKTEALIQKYQHIKTGLMHDLFTRGIGENGKLRPPRSEAPELYKETEIGWIPKEWEVSTLQDLCSTIITYGIVQAGPHIEGGIPYIRTGDMAGDYLSKNKLLCTSTTIASSFKRSEVKSGEIVCAIRATVGKVLFVPDELDGANLTQGTARISPVPTIDSSFLLWVLRTFQIQSAITSQIKGTTFNEITLTNLRELPVFYPQNRDEQEIISQKMNTSDKMISKLKADNKKLRKLKTGLMHDLLTGKVQVTVNDTETADV